MDTIPSCLAILFAIPLYFITAQSRPFDHLPLSQISASPSPAPEASNSIPHSSIFSVLSYGAVGNGVHDDTQAFKMAWDAACAADDSPVILVPNHYTFMIQSAIFSGPCKKSLVFQVRLICSLNCFFTRLYI